MVLAYCLITVTLSSFLLFLIQPLAAKALLPLFGGVPSVWNVCMVFFQGMLLLGYFYVYLTERFFTFQRQRLFHFVIGALSLSMLPILWKDIQPPAGIHPALDVLWLLLTKLALPLFIISTTAPLIQSWFAKTSHPHARDPYFLYSASNLGSLLALLGFPFLFEPLFGLQHLSRFWSATYMVFTAALLFSAIQCKGIAFSTPATAAPQTRVHWRQRMHWTLLSFAPASLLMAVTQYLTTDIMAVPLLWVLPLAIYLLAFIIAFSRHPVIRHTWMTKEQALFLIFPLICLSREIFTLPAWLLIMFHLSGFFALSMVCLGELSARRPDKSHLTEFYLWLSIGGFLGGLFNGLLAPQIFNGIYEYHLAFCLCILLRPAGTGQPLWRRSDYWMPLAIGMILILNYFLIVKNYSLYPAYDRFGFTRWIDLLVMISVVLVILDHDQRPLRFAANVAVLFIYAQFLPAVSHNTLLWQSRNFFGVSRVYNNPEFNLHFLMSGTTLHGAQRINLQPRFTRAATYYQPVQPIARLLGQEKPSLRIGIAGLGTGGISCQFRARDQVYFYEIDPVVVQIARTPSLFTYLRDCPPQGGITLGDARLNLAKTPARYFDAIIIDVFSSDAIPAHLFTREAISLYLQKITPDGLVMFNISSRHINLYAVLATLAQELNLQAYSYHSTPADDAFQAPSDWVILAYPDARLQQWMANLHWKKMDAPRPPLSWTDDYSNILQALK
ncbi:Polyamine aminopropyltransferase [Aquicella siphonis]|uniref:Polyamine aminopropyltransferase n=1 Tax=Aquicella siphonis TaxID=254247 RepID=A0A5E4PJD6_9COXI|nr:fused MFS/spermidine synthase [Aquicella siphonis]VVC76492.1 Polyamine aminopropyltransferase [Aquicella siphonis]